MIPIILFFDPFSVDLKGAPLTALPQFETKNPYHRSGQRRESIAGESVNEEELKSTKKVFHEKSAEARKGIAEKTARNLLFRNLDRKQKEGTQRIGCLSFFVVVANLETDTKSLSLP